MLSRVLFLFVALLPCWVIAQVQNYGMTDRQDSVVEGKVQINGYVDTYYGFDLNQPKDSWRAYAVSSPRHNEININLAYIDIRYQEEMVRARFVPGVGTYINSNYATEAGTLKNIVEANVGVRLSEKKGIWIDAGVLGSPFTNETAISKDHLLYTRSFAAENAPYYVTGARLTLPINKKLTAYGYVLNGWQIITDVNNPLSGALQLEYKPTDKLLINWNNYIGSEESKQNPLFGNRFFTDLYFIYQPVKWFSATADVYGGLQNKLDTITGKRDNFAWWQFNVCARIKPNPKLSFSYRFEYYDDPNAIVVIPITNTKGFSTFSESLGIDRFIGNHAIFRIEGRHFFSSKEVYLNQEDKNSKNGFLLMSSLCVWF